ncbi:molecular chaperone DnaK [Neobacillus piezotolerans]|uniref:Molecular chaperone DnaK n=1 Tax=Neobacillus piezotolerans TaxID=2259171 RepID=A0A3D8GPW2_9BACI|nr:TraR/DksA C4-type zinc finger protein [Neobacillus piezotolerans]RDU36106.1 molecular chaperone DnaK [Neobacillus piezotolerans]
MLTTNQLNSLKYLLKEEEKALEKQLEMKDGYGDRDKDETETVGELSSYDNHPADLGTELFEREKNFALDGHADSQLEKVKEALAAFEDGSYGVCRECGEEIPYERLEAVPSTLYCVEHTPDRTTAKDRPVEEDILDPSVPNSFRGRSKGGVIDTNDSFEEVAHYGTSEGPQDLVGDYNSYEELYRNGINEEAPPEDIEEFVSNDMDGGNRKYNPSNDKLKELENMLDRKGLDSQMGDVHYHRKDSYVDDKKK